MGTLDHRNFDGLPVRVIEKHPLWVRIFHWFNAPILSLMIWSGILIYWANDVYPGFFPQWFYNFFKIDHRLAEGLAVHFTIGWFFVFNGLAYLILFFWKGHWKEILPNRKTFKDLIPTVLHDLGLRQQAPLHGKFNAAQKLAYSTLIFLAVVEGLSGFAIYKPVQLSWLTLLFGGYEGARLIHFIAMISICLFILVHLVQVLRAGWRNFQSMVTGFEVDDE